jgi:hypothetical protein
VLKAPFNGEEDSIRHNYETLQCEASSTTTGRRKDLYDNHIEKYMATKYDNQELLNNYLTNRKQFIQQACLEIEK